MMKIAYLALVTTSLYFTVALASTNINSYGAGNRDESHVLGKHASHADSRAHSQKALEDHKAFDGNRNRLAENGNKYQGVASASGHKAGQSAVGGKSAKQNFAKQDAKYDEIARQIAEASKVRGYQSGSEGRYDKVDDNKARGYNNAGAKKTAYNRGKVFNDNIEYGFNKDFAENLSEKGGYEEENGHNAHKLDELRDRQKGRKLVRGEHSAANARSDSQHAVKETDYKQKAAQKQAARGKFGNKESKLDKAGATQDAQSVLYDRKDSKSLAEDKGHQLAANNAKQFANKDNKFGRNAAASHGGAQGHADKKYYGGHGDKGGHGVGPEYDGTGPVPVSGAHVQGSGGLANHKYGESAKQTDNGKEHQSQNAGATDQALKKYDQTKKKQDFDQLKSLRDQRKGKFAQGVHNSENNGFSAKDAEAAKTASGADRKYADATAHSNAKAAKHDLDEELFDKENYKKRLHDNNENFRKVKKFYHDKKAGGKNVESLKYTRKRIENEFGSAQSAQQEKQNQYDNAHKDAKHHAASRKDNFADAKKASKAFAHHDANKATSGGAASHASNFHKANNFDNAHKKQIAESDHSSNKDALQKKQKDQFHHVANAKSDKGNGFKNVNGHERESKGSPVGGSGFSILGSSSAHRAQPAPVHIAPVKVETHIPHVQPRHNDRPKTLFGSVHGNDFGKFNQGHGQRSIGGHGDSHSGYGSNNNNNNNIHKFGGSLFGGRSSSFGHGSGHGDSFGSKNFGLFGSFGRSSGSNIGSGFSARSSPKAHTPVSGGLFSSPFGSSFGRKSGLFSSNFQFGRKFKGVLF